VSDPEDYEGDGWENPESTFTSLIKSEAFAPDDWYDLLTNNIFSWSDKHSQIIELHLKSRLSESEYHNFIFTWCTLCEDGYDTEILYLVRSTIKQNKDSEEFIELFKRIILKTIQIPDQNPLTAQRSCEIPEQVVYALMRAWKLEDEEKGKSLFVSCGLDFDSFLKEDAEVDGIY
tara:strand:+ start:228 stop:752 length:525 start_codon:yes stop_codon:yes gene_type:complete